jgi:hypothetical protein
MKSYTNKIHIGKNGKSLNIIHEGKSVALTTELLFLTIMNNYPAEGRNMAGAIQASKLYDALLKQAGKEYIEIEDNTWLLGAAKLICPVIWWTDAPSLVDFIEKGFETK